MPADLAKAIARVTSAAQGTWAQARADEDVAAFLPVAQEVVALKRQEGAALAQGGDVYDAMVEDYEPYTTGAQIAAKFSTRCARVWWLCAPLFWTNPRPAPLTGTF